MAILESIRSESLIRIACERFDPELTPQERAILKASVSADRQISTDTPSERLPVRPAFLRWLATDQDANQLVDPLGIRVRHVKIDDTLDFRRCRIALPWFFEDCIFSKNFLLDRAELAGLSMPACVMNGQFSAQGLTIHGHLSLHGTSETGAVKGLRCVGEMDLLAARIEGDFDACGVCLEGKNASLKLARAQIAGSVFLRKGFVAKGWIALGGAKIGGDLVCEDAEIDTLGCNHVQIANTFSWKRIKNPKQADLRLSDSTIRTIEDDRASWPRQGNLRLTGLTYTNLVCDDKTYNPGHDAVFRSPWLNLQPKDQRAQLQPWMHFAQLLRARGDKKGARRVIFGLRMNQADGSKGLPMLLKLLFALLEEQPLRIILPLTFFVCMGTYIFANAGQGPMAPTNKDVYKGWKDTGVLSTAYPKFNPFFYSFEDALPFIKIGQDEKWAPDPNHSDASLAQSYSWLTFFRWLLIVSGWVQGTVLAAALGSRFKTD